MADPLAAQQRLALLHDLRAVENDYASAMSMLDDAIRDLNHAIYRSGDPRQPNDLMISDLGPLAKTLERMIWSDRQLLVDRKVLFQGAANHLERIIARDGGHDGKAKG